MNGKQAKRLRAIARQVGENLPDVAYTESKARITNNTKRRSILKDHEVNIPVGDSGATETVTIQVPDYDNILVRRLDVKCIRNIYQTEKQRFKKMTPIEKFNFQAKRVIYQGV